MLMLKAYAKINIGLKVVGKDETDGYHFLDMVNLPLELHDRIEIEKLPDNYDTIITSDDMDLPTDETNIVFKIHNALKERYHFKDKFRIHIHKVIPLCSGLGGGSADAAAVLLGLNQILKLKLKTEEMIEISKKIGYDIPFCLFNQPGRVLLKGEQVENFKKKKKYHVLIVRPKDGLETRNVYKEYDLHHDESNVNNEALIKGLMINDLELIRNNMGDDLECVSSRLNPQIKEAHEDLVKLGFDMVTMTGSGSCVYALSLDEKKIKAASELLDKKKYRVFVTKTL